MVQGWRHEHVIKAAQACADYAATPGAKADAQLAYWNYIAAMQVATNADNVVKAAGSRSACACTN